VHYEPTYVYKNLMKMSVRVLRSICVEAAEFIGVRTCVSQGTFHKTVLLSRKCCGPKSIEARQQHFFSTHSNPFGISGTPKQTDDLKDRQQKLQKKGLPKKLPIPGVEHVILVASGKGGVGKSTTAVNLAVALSQVNQGLKVGILDADIYGPSIPTLMNLSGEPELNHQNLMLPLVNYGIKCMSMGFLVGESSALVWRGLMVMAAVQRLLRQVVWGPLDVLVVDMPPGTGDVQLSVSQNIPVSGAVVVTTPQDLALMDARRAVAMFSSVGVATLGLVENMSVWVCPACGHKEHVFGEGGAKNLQKQAKADILGQVPLTSSLRQLSDAGRPVVISQPGSAESQVYKDIASQLISKLNISTTNS